MLFDTSLSRADMILLRYSFERNTNCSAPLCVLHSTVQAARSVGILC